MKICGKGHEYTTLQCSVCLSKARKIKYLLNSEKILAKNAAWKAAHPDKNSASKKQWALKNKDRAAKAKKKSNAAWYIANKEQRSAQIKAWFLTNEEKAREKKRQWVLLNTDKVLATAARYRAAKLQQTPPWYTHTDCVAIYKELKPGYHLDHIIPLQGELVSGLHWHHNLQLLPAAENIAKSNKFDPDTYVHELPFY